jgi:hypothetical protein
MMAISEMERVRVRHRALSVIEAITAAGDIWKKERGTHVMPMGYYQNISLELLYGNDDWFVFHPEETTPSVLWPIDVCLISDQRKTGKEDRFDFNLAHVRSASPRELRGKARLFSKYMVKNVACGMDGDFVNGVKTTGGVAIYSAYIAGKWVQTRASVIGVETANRHADPIPVRDWKNDDEGVAVMPALAIGVALRHRYEWAVSIGRDDGPSARVAVDPTAIKELFKFRDAPDGKLRRSSLMTWVSDHWRQTRKDADVEAYVRKHIRGNAAFKWEGLNVAILPPEYDLELEGRLIDDRAAMRRAGQDRRAV